MRTLLLVLQSVPTLLFVSPAAAVTLDEALRAAETKSELLAQSREQAAQADERLAQIRGGIFPQLSFSANHTIQPEPADPVARSFSPRHQTTASFGLTQPIFRGLREFAGLRQQRHLRSAIVATGSQTLARLRLEAAAAFLNVLSLEQDLANLDAQLKTYDDRVAELEARVSRGESSESELLSARSTLASVGAERRLVEGQLGTARETFHFVTGLPPESPVTEPSLLAAGDVSATLDSYLARVEARPDVTAARARLDAADQGVSVAWGAHLPSVDLVANYYVARPGFLKDLKWDVGIRLTVPLFEGGTTVARVREAVSRESEAKLDLERTRRAAVQEIRSAYQRFRARVEHVTALKRSLELAERNSRVVQRDFRRGLTRNLDVQLALAELNNSRRSHDQSRFSAELELLQLRTAAVLTVSGQEGPSQ